MILWIWSGVNRNLRPQRGTFKPGSFSMALSTCRRAVFGLHRRVVARSARVRRRSVMGRLLRRVDAGQRFRAARLVSGFPFRNGFL
jgi:hypothetical protein